MDLREYIKDQLKKGYDAYAVRTYLIRQGYNEHDVDSAFDDASSKPAFKIMVGVLVAIVVIGIFSYAAFQIVKIQPDYESPGVSTDDNMKYNQKINKQDLQNNDDVNDNYGNDNDKNNNAPSCYDGLKNCHSGKCEAGVDCGGPCSLCQWQVRDQEIKKQQQESEPVKVSFATCTDGIRNGVEAGVDCGGSCSQCIIASTSLTNLEMLEKAKELASVDTEKAAKSCDELTEGIRDRCLGEIAKQVNNEKYCEQISSETIRDSCYTDFALSGKTELCIKIADIDLRDACNQLKLLDDKDGQ